MFLKFSPAEDAFRKNHAQRAQQYEGVGLAGVAALGRDRSTRVCKMLGIEDAQRPRL